MWSLLLATSLAAPPAASRHHVVGATPDDDDAWPDAVALLGPEGVACTGTLIAPDVVLTAAHCLPDIRQAAVGDATWADADLYDLQEEAPHPLDQGGLDLAWVRLAEPADVEPRPLARSCQLDALAAGDRAWIVGFGATTPSGTGRSDVRMAGRTTIVSPTCDDPAAGCAGGVPAEAELRAGGDGVDACVGDSGGPLYLPHPDGDLLLGVTSRAALGGRTVCGDGGIFVRVDAAVAWLETELGPLGADPCGSTPPPPDDLKGCGCDTTGAPTAAWPLLVLAWRRRRA